MNERERLIELLRKVQDYGIKHTSEEWSVTVECKDNKNIADYLLAHGVTVQRWIPVTERLPEEDVDVLCFSDSYGGTRFIGYIDYRCKAWIEDGMLHIGNVTHWMPLPKPPKEE